MAGVTWYYDAENGTLTANAVDGPSNIDLDVLPVARHPDGKLTATLGASKTAARLTVVDKVKADALTDDDVSAISPLFDPWAAGLDVKVGDVYAWDGTLVECIQAHTTQQDWTPPATPSLWKVHRTDDGTVPLAWMPGLALTLTDQVTYDGVTYDVLQAHTTQEGWTPPATPALFEPAA